MTRRILQATAMALALAAPTVALAQGTGSTTGTMSQSGSQASLSAQDQIFVEMATSSDMFEVRSSQLALQQSQLQDVRRFAQHMIQDHQGTSQQLVQIIQTLGVQQPTTMKPELQQRLAQLSTLGPDTFDQVYINDQVIAHQAAVEAFQQQASIGSNAQLKSFAAQTLPTLQQHLAEVTGMRDMLVSQGGPNATGAVSRGISGAGGTAGQGSGSSIPGTQQPAR
ncbi:DUF4142 domain-containing protein [Arenibaculum pallidiluteum]|uniref:DUF4142 domain-containing protein n=1 Tax=Arenibaculum pallidiluteum TaxID=2812559 RepID=UPI001A96AF0A|nr:DUF4142 domain-containing protein [Arenibaculum pallidiluteum]